MTTLPTREDGGIDWGGLHIEDGAVWKTGSYEPIKLEEIAEHTRERCAKVAEDGAELSLSVAMASMDETGVEAAKIGVAICDKIRKLEV